MTTPRVEINLGKIAHNTNKLIELYASKNIDVIGVTKAVGGDPSIAYILVKSGITTLADSRISNIRKLRDAGINAQFLLLRTPLSSQCEDVIKYTDISLNSELSIIKKLSKLAREYGVIHDVILMVEMGDLREGVMPGDLENIVEQVIELKGVHLAGIGTNLGCFGGVKPDEKKMRSLSAIAQDIEDKFSLTLKIISGGNSANYCWFTSVKDVGKINNLRLGESIYLGREGLHGRPIPELYTDAFSLITEVIELKIKPSTPYGEVCHDAFGQVPQFKDDGLIKRAILAIGLQDVQISGLIPESGIRILCNNSDHTIVQAKEKDLKVGDEVKFDLNYAGLLSAMTSPYVNKKYDRSFECSGLLLNGRTERLRA